MNIRVEPRKNSLSGISVEMLIAKGANGDLTPRVRGRWWSDRPLNGVASGDFDVARGEIILSSADFTHVRPLFIQFQLDAHWSGVPKLVSGGIVVAN